MTAPEPRTESDDESPFDALMPARPYPGLRPFNPSEWPIFFGRERMVDAVVTGLVRHQFIAVHGDSGAGKSSLIRAGVLPRLRQEQARGGIRWRTCVALPRGGPLRNMARALAALDGRVDDAEHVLDLRRAFNQGRRAPAALANLMLKGEQDHLCLLIDQFEELFEFARDTSQAEAQLVTDLLVTMAESPPRGLYVVLTMRSEYLGACARFPGLAEAVNSRQYLLPPMAVADLVRAICEPAALYDGVVDRVLAERLAADAALPDGLPLVQHALMLMHRQLGGQTPWRLTPDHYPSDGLSGLLSRHADQVAAEAGRDAPERLVEDMFRALTTVTPEGHAIRRPMPIARLVQTTGAPLAAVVRALNLFRADGVSFLVAYAEARDLLEDDWIDIGHEALMRCWKALADPADGWLAREARNGLVWRSLLVQAESFERDPGNVLSEATTDERQRWLARRNPVWAERYGGGWDRVQQLVRASAQARDAAQEQRERARAQEQALRLRAQRQRWMIGVVGGIAVLSIAATSLVMNERDKAQQQSRLADQQRIVAEEQRKLADRRGIELEALLDDTRNSEATLRATLTQLQSALRVGSGAELRTQVTQATRELSAAADKLQQAEVAPRVYLHIGDERQRAAADAFNAALAQQRLDGVPLLTPGVQLVPAQTNNGVLRCFRADECRDEAPRLLKLLNALLATPKLELQDLSQQYGTSSKIRPHHFEVWFGHRPIALQPAPQD